MYRSLAGILAVGLIATGAHAQIAAKPAPAPFSASAHLEIASARADAGDPGVRTVAIAPPADLEDDDSGDYMKHMTPAQLERLYAQHDAEVARLMAAAPDEDLVGEASLVDPLTGEEVSIDLVAF
jgi:hypothetical protein